MNEHFLKYLYSLTIALIFIGCAKNKTSNSIESNRGNLIERQLIRYEYEDSIYNDIEYYINAKNDTVINQIKIYKKGIIDTLSSHFYDLWLTPLTNGKSKGNITFHSSTDTIIKKTRELEFGFAQSSGDSIYFKTFKVINKKSISFEYGNFRNNTFMGYLYEVISIPLDSIPNEERKVRLIFSNTMVDNKVFTSNPYFGVIYE